MDFLRFPGDASGKDLCASAGDITHMGLIPGWGRSPGGGHDNPLQYSCLENPHGRRSLAGCSPWGCEESDVTELTACMHKLKTEKKKKSMRPRG